MDIARLNSPLDKAVLGHVAALEGLTAEDIIRVDHDFYSQTYVFDTRRGLTFKVSDEVIRDIVYYIERNKPMQQIKPRFNLAEIARRLQNMPPGFYMDSLNQAWFDEKPKPKKLSPIEVYAKDYTVGDHSPQALIVGLHMDDSFELAHFLGINHAKHVTHYRDMMKYRGLKVYITERGPERDDFGAIEGLFIQGGHTVIDVME